MARGDEERAAEARAALQRLTRDNRPIFPTAMPRLGALLGDREADPEDRAERWGRRIGRGLAIVVFGFFVLNLFTHWIF